MKKLILAASIALLTACASPSRQQLNLVFTPEISSSPIVKNATYALVSKDVRSAQYVVIIDDGKTNNNPIHARQNIRLALEKAVAEQFASQGFRVNPNSENTVTLEIQQALVSVKQSKMRNDMDGKVSVLLSAETTKGKLSKLYNSSAKRSGMLSASNDEIEMVLNDVINLVLQEIANDHELKTYMQERF